MMLSIIVPCFNEQEVLPFFMQEINKTLKDFQDHDIEIIFINDGSSDETLQIIKKIAQSDPRVKYVSFSRNFGKEAALYAGLRKAKGDLTAVMDADLQDPPGLLLDMCRAVEEEGYDSAAARRSSRKGEPAAR